jgi:hypothetical protein
MERTDGLEVFRHIPELDLTAEICAARASGEWFMLAEYFSSARNVNVENQTQRQSILIPIGAFARLYDQLTYVGNVLTNLGSPVISAGIDAGERTYEYAPFHRFNFTFTDIVGEPLAFFRPTRAGVEPVINLDLVLFFGLEARADGAKAWLDPRTGSDVVVVATGQRTTVEVRLSYLNRYLRARQMNLLVAHFRRMLYYDPGPAVLNAFTEAEVTVGSPGSRMKAWLFNAGPRDGFGSPFIQSELHLWYTMPTVPINMEHPFDAEPSFDVHTFTLPTERGFVAPGRFRVDSHSEEPFDGGEGSFTDSVFFSQEVLSKYEISDEFVVDDDGSVRCHHYWALNRSTQRFGDELLSTYIGDFAEGVPYDEWPHWRHYAVQPPGMNEVVRLRSEPSITEAVNSLVESLEQLNPVFRRLALGFAASSNDTLWKSPSQTSTTRQLKRFYSVSAGEDEFLRRATLVSTLATEGFSSSPMRSVLRSLGPDMDMNEENPPKPLGSLRLLERIVLGAAITARMNPKLDALADLILEAEARSTGSEHDLTQELVQIRKAVRTLFEAITFVYDLRTHGGVAHRQNVTQARVAAKNMSLPGGGWTRADYLGLLRQVKMTVDAIRAKFAEAVDVLSKK